MCRQKDEQKNTRQCVSFALWILNIKPCHECVRIHLKINCFQLMWWQFNHFKMCNSASWAHHSWLVEFGEHSSRDQSTMCTSSTVNASSKGLPFFMSGHVWHLIVFSSLLYFYAHQLCLFCCHVWVCNSGSSLIGWLSRGQEAGVLLNIPGRLWEVSFWLHSFCSSVISECRFYHCFPMKILFCFGEKQNTSAEWYQETSHHDITSCWRYWKSEHFDETNVRISDLNSLSTRPLNYYLIVYHNYREY